MTFSLIGRCARTGQVGAAATTSTPAGGPPVPAVARPSGPLPPALAGGFGGLWPGSCR